MSYLEKFLEGILEELHCRLDGLPLERASREARDLLETNLVDPAEVLKVFVGELRECSRCGTAWRECEMEEDVAETGTRYICMHCF